MNDYTFTLRFTSPNDDLDVLSQRVCPEIDDASLMGPAADGTFLLEFDRSASSISVAVADAIGELRRVLPEATLLRIEHDDLATVADIAERAGRTTESIRLLVSGKRGSGGFPAPAGMLGARTKVWRWTEVEQWFAGKLGEPLTEDEAGAFLAALNDALELGRLSERLDADQRRAVARALPAALVAA